MRLYNRTRARAEEAAGAGGAVVDSPAEATRGADAVVTMLADPEALLAVVEGERGILETIGRDAVLIDSSTVSPPTTLRVAARLVLLATVGDPASDPRSRQADRLQAAEQP